MKNIIGASLLVFLTACGAKTPFQRGDSSVAVETRQSDNVDPTNAGPTNPAGGQNPVDIPTKPDEKMFNEAVLPMLEKKCSLCHDNPFRNYAEASAKVVFKSPADSLIYKYATGAGGIHRRILKDGSAELIVLESWINGAVHL